MKQTNYLKFAFCVAASVLFVGCAGTRYSRSTGQYIDDKATAARVNSALHKDSLVESADINVESFRGNVHLTGFVDHPVQKERASELTRNVRGVNWFKNDIVVKGALPTESQMPNGQQINESAGANRASNYQQQNFQQNSSRQMSGAASSSAKSEGWQKGAINVYDPAANISVQPSPVVRDQSRASTSRADERGASALISKEPAGSSNNLAQRVSMQLRSENSAAAQNVQVENSGNGKITLKGTVSSDAEKDQIESQAKAIPGVNDVDNQLDVQK